MSLMPMGEGEYDSHAAIWSRAVLAEMPMGSFLLELQNGYRGRVERRTFDLVDEIAKQVDERLMRDRLQESEQLEPVFWRCMRSAADSPHAGKRRLLGKALANAFLDDALVDEVEILEGVLTNIDTPHIAALARRGRPPVRQHPHRRRPSLCECAARRTNSSDRPRLGGLPYAERPG